MKTQKNKLLSAFPYYGGKAKMSPLICSLLDYDNTTVYVEPFGGGCRTLLNKKPHKAEIYNDFGFGLTSFFSVMSDMAKTEQLITMLMDNPPTKEQFQYLFIRRMEIEDRLNTSTNAIVSAMALRSYKRYKMDIFNDLKRAVNREDYPKILELLENILDVKTYASILEPEEELQYKHYFELYKDFWKLIEADPKEIRADAENAFKIEWERTIGIPEKGTIHEKAYMRDKEKFVTECIEDAIHSYTDDTLISNEAGTSASDLEIAFIIFQLYYSSRDGMGLDWSNEKNKNMKAYYRAVSNLRNVAQRLENVMVTQCDALYLIRQFRKESQVMLYLDPSYLKPEDEYKNLGKVYKMSYSYQDHKKLLEEITKPDTQAKILISNYDVDLYNLYLCDWKKTYFKTFTGVGGKHNNRRLEVLWQNY